jgi:hypothetical protein
MPGNVTALVAQESRLQSHQSPDSGDWRISVAPMMDWTNDTPKAIPKLVSY